MTEGKLTLGVDFCGVIMSHTSGWQGPTAIVDPPNPGAIEFLKAASERFKVAIMSGRFRHASVRIPAQRAVREWLIAHGIPDHWVTVDPDWSGRIVLANLKPSCHAILDDRAIPFRGEFPDIATLEAFRPWRREV